MGLRVRAHRLGDETLWSYDTSLPVTPELEPESESEQPKSTLQSEPAPRAKPPVGYYRQLLPSPYAHLRLALANQPMTGVEVQPVTVVRTLVQHLDTLTDPFAAYYASGLRDHTIIPVALRATDYAPGELFLKS